MWFRDTPYHVIKSNEETLIRFFRARRIFMNGLKDIEVTKEQYERDDDGVTMHGLAIAALAGWAACPKAPPVGMAQPKAVPPLYWDGLAWSGMDSSGGVDGGVDGSRWIVHTRYIWMQSILVQRFVFSVCR